MSNIDDLQRRILAAMDRVAQGLDQLGSAPTGPDPELEQALEDERTANAQLTERVRSLKSRLETETAALQSKIDESNARLEQLDIELQRLKHSNGELVDAAAALRDANSEGLADPHLINKAMVAELEGLRAARATEIAEAQAIMAALMPLVDTASQAQEENA